MIYNNSSTPLNQSGSNDPRTIELMSLEDAVYNNDFGAVKTILANYANPDEVVVREQRRGDVSFLETAICRDRIDVVKAILESVRDPNHVVTKQNGYGNTAIHWAVDSDLEMTKEVLKHVTNPNEAVMIQNSRGETALHKAAYLDCSEESELLLSHVVNPDEAMMVRDKNGNTPLMCVISDKKCTSETVEVLLKHSADPDKMLSMIANNEGQTPLMIACRTPRHCWVAMTMIEHIVNYDKVIMMKDIDGRTAFHHAILGNNVDAAEQLLNVCPAVFEQIDNFNKLAEQYIEFSQMQKIFQMFRDKQHAKIKPIRM